jgi:hypothetical protein
MEDVAALRAELEDTKLKLEALRAQKGSLSMLQGDLKEKTAEVERLREQVRRTARAAPTRAGSRVGCADPPGAARLRRAVCVIDARVARLRSRAHAQIRLSRAPASPSARSALVAHSARAPGPDAGEQGAGDVARQPAKGHAHHF